MATIQVDGIKTFEAPDGRRLVLAIEDAGIDILHRCGGKCKCTTCRVLILNGDAGERTEAEVERLAREDQIEPNMRLSCQMLADRDLELKVLMRLSESGLSDAGPEPGDQIEP